MQHEVEPVPVLDTPQVVVHEVETVKLLMVPATVMMLVTYWMTVAQMLPVQEVTYN